MVGHIAVPGDKSISHRAVLIGAICDGETRVSGFGRSADTESTIAAVRALGVDVYEHGDDTLRIFGRGLRGLAAPDGPIDCGNAGTLVRLLAGILAGQGGEFELTGDDSLSARPMGRIAEPLGRMGALVETTDGSPANGDHGSTAARDRLRPACRERAGEVGRAPRRALRGRRDDRRRAGADPRPHRADARSGRRSRRGSPDERHGVARRAARARRDRGTGRLLVGGAVRGRRDARPRFGAPRPRRQPQPAPHRAPRDPRANGRERDGLQPPGDRRGARRRPRDPLGASRGNDGARQRSAARDRRVAPVRACGGVRAWREHADRRGGAACEGDGPDRRDRRGPARTGRPCARAGRRPDGHGRPVADPRRQDGESRRPPTRDARRRRGARVARRRAGRGRGRGRSQLPGLLRRWWTSSGASPSSSRTSGGKPHSNYPPAR